MTDNPSPPVGLSGLSGLSRASPAPRASPPQASAALLEDRAALQETCSRSSSSLNVTRRYATWPLAMRGMSSAGTPSGQEDSEAGTFRSHELAHAWARPNPRVYEVWPQVGGRNRFLCRGRCITGPRIDLWYNCCAWSFILVPCCFYFVVCARYLWDNVSKWLPIFTTLIFFFSVILLLATQCTDPGILPRHALQIAVDGLEAEVANFTGAEPLSVDAVTSEPVAHLTEEQSNAGYRWCTSCKVIRPPRASHCRDCDNCVLVFDHHCPFVNNCVGQRNYAYFSGFLVSTGCLGFAVFTGIGIYFSHLASGENDTQGPWLYVLLALIGIPTALLLLGVIGLLTFHTFLACRGRTTKEALTSREVQRGSKTLFTVRGPSLIHARDRVRFPMAVV